MSEPRNRPRNLPMHREFIKECIAAFSVHLDEILERFEKTAEGVIESATEDVLRDSRAVVFNVSFYDTDPPSFIAFVALSPDGLPPKPVRKSVPGARVRRLK